MRTLFEKTILLLSLSVSGSVAYAADPSTHCEFFPRNPWLEVNLANEYQRRISSHFQTNPRVKAPIISFIVDSKSWNPVAVRIVQSSGNIETDKAAVKAIYKSAPFVPRTHYHGLYKVVFSPIIRVIAADAAIK